jgi:hypothetical protein
MVRFGLPLALLFIWLCAGCATVGDSHQILPVMCEPEPCRLKFDSNKQEVELPAFVKLERERKVSLIYSRENELQTETLSGKVRWTESVIPNILLGAVGPVFAVLGLAIDFLTGNVYELPVPTPHKFEERLEVSEAPLGPVNSRNRFLIAPVQADTQEFSDWAVASVLGKLREQYPNHEVEVPENYYSQYERADWNFETPVFELKQKLYENSAHSWKFFELFNSLPSTQIVFCKVHRGESGVYEVQYEIFDVLRRKSIGADRAAMPMPIAKREITQIFKSKLRDFVPNALSLRQRQISQSIFGMNSAVAKDPVAQSYSQKQTIAYSQSSGSGGGPAGQSEWELSLTNVEPDLGRRFSFVTKWASDLRLRRSQTTIVRADSHFQVAGSSAQEQTGFQYSEQHTNVEQYFAGLGFGPEVGIVGGLGYVYFNILLGAEIGHFRFSNQSDSLTEFITPATANFGYQLPLSSALQLSLQASLRRQPNHTNDRVLSRAAGQGMEARYAAEAMMAFGLSYYFPEGQSWGRSRLQ